MNRGASVIRLVLLSVALLALVLLGLVYVPAWNERSGVIAVQGTTVTVNPESDAFIPFSVSQGSKISGSLTSNALIDVFVVNSTQFMNMGSYSHPSDYVFSSGYVDSLALNLPLTKGFYYLVFYDTVPADSGSIVMVHVTHAIELAPD